MIRISTRLDYGLRAMLEMALRDDPAPVQSRSIALSQCIPEPYLTQLLTVLRKSGLVESRRGPGGGHQLARPADEILLSEIVAVLEGPQVVAYEAAEDSGNALCCTDTLEGVWQHIGQQVHATLSSVTLANLVERVRRRSLTYQI